MSSLNYTTTTSIKSLDRLRQELVVLDQLASDGEVDGAVTDGNNEATLDLVVNDVGELQGLALADELRASNGSVDLFEGGVVELLDRGDGGLDEALAGVVELLVVSKDLVDDVQTVVAGESGEETGEDLVTANVLGDDLDDVFLVSRAQAGVSKNLLGLVVSSQQISQLRDGSSGLRKNLVLGSSDVEGAGVGAVEAVELEGGLDNRLLGVSSGESGSHRGHAHGAGRTKRDRHTTEHWRMEERFWLSKARSVIWLAEDRARGELDTPRHTKL